MVMRVSDLPSIFGHELPLGYTVMSPVMEIAVGKEGQIGEVLIYPAKEKPRLWMPNISRSSDVTPILGADKLDYYHPTIKTKCYDAMLELLKGCNIPEADFIVAWMLSDAPIKLKSAFSELPKADHDALSSGRIVWQVGDDYFHNLPTVKAFIEKATLDKAIGDGGLSGVLPQIHTVRLQAPLYGCNTDMFRSWGQSGDLGLDARSALIETQRYTEMLEHPKHNIRIGGRYWLWGATAEAKDYAESIGLLDLATNPSTKERLQNLVVSTTKGAKGDLPVPVDPKILAGWIGMGGSGKGRAAIGQMSEISLIKLLQNISDYHSKQLRYLDYSLPYWQLARLVVAEGSSKAAIDKASTAIFNVMINGGNPPLSITKAVIARMEIEGVPNILGKKSNRQWAQLTYLSWISPDFENMKPVTTPDNLLAWHVGKVFAECKSLSFNYKKPEKGSDWKDPIDGYRQVLFSNPSRGFSRLMQKICAYRSSNGFFVDKALQALNEDCSGLDIPDRWSDTQKQYLAIGMSEIATAKATTATKEN